MFDTTELRNVANEIDLPLGRFAPGDNLRHHQRSVLQAADEIDRLVNLLRSLPHARPCLLRLAALVGAKPLPEMESQE